MVTITIFFMLFCTILVAMELNIFLSLHVCSWSGRKGCPAWSTSFNWRWKLGRCSEGRLVCFIFIFIFLAFNWLSCKFCLCWTADTVVLILTSTSRPIFCFTFCILFQLLIVLLCNFSLVVLLFLQVTRNLILVHRWWPGDLWMLILQMIGH